MNNTQIAAALRQLAAALDVEAPAAPASAPVPAPPVQDFVVIHDGVRYTGRTAAEARKKATTAANKAAKARAAKAPEAPAPKVRFLTSKSLPDFKREFPQAAGLSTRQVVEIVLDEERATGEMPAGWEVGPKYRALYAEAQARLATGKHVA